MESVIVLDTSPLGLMCHVKRHLTTIKVREWSTRLVARGRRIIIAEISDYEVRRELIRCEKKSSIDLLNVLHKQFEYLPITTQDMRLAAELWAQVRQAGKPTSDVHALDGDVILAAQTINLGIPAVVATNNISHIARFTKADLWQNITP